jgi:hypothetical protein
LGADDDGDGESGNSGNAGTAGTAAAIPFPLGVDAVFENAGAVAGADCVAGGALSAVPGH